MAKKIFISICLFLLYSCNLKSDNPATKEVFPSIEVSYPSNNSIVSTNFEVYGTISQLSDVEGIYLIVSDSQFRAQTQGFHNFNYWNCELNLSEGLYQIQYFIKLTSGKSSETNTINILVSNVAWLSISSPTNGELFTNNDIPIAGVINSSGDCDLKIVLNATNTIDLYNQRGSFQTNIKIENGLNILDFELKQNGMITKKRRVFKGPAIEALTMAKRLGKGINMGNSLEAYPDEDSWGNPIKDEYFTLMKQAGFDTVRIPIRWSAHALTSSPYSIDSTFFSRVDHVVDTALNAGLNVIINIHHYEELMTDPEGHKERFLALWSQIATHYKG